LLRHAVVCTTNGVSVRARSTPYGTFLGQKACPASVPRRAARPGGGVRFLVCPTFFGRTRRVWPEGPGGPLVWASEGRATPPVFRTNEDTPVPSVGTGSAPFRSPPAAGDAEQAPSVPPTT